METPETIYQWAAETFDTPSVLSIGARLMVEVSELFCAVVELDEENAESRQQIAEEIADVAIVYAQIGWVLNKMKTQAWDRTSETDGTDTKKLCGGLPATVTDLIRAAGNLSNRIVLGDSTKTYCDASRAVLKEIKRCALILDVDLQRAIDKKMTKNRNRTWVRTTTNRFQHASETKESSRLFNYPNRTHQCSVDRWYLITGTGRILSGTEEGFTSTEALLEWCFESEIPVRFQPEWETIKGVYGVRGDKLVQQESLGYAERDPTSL